jgi:hypothetical protein
MGRPEIKKILEIAKRGWKLIGTVILCLAAIAVICVLWYAYGELRAGYTRLQTNYGSLETNYGDLQIDYGKLKTDYGKLQSDYDGLLKEKGSLEAALAATQTELSQANKAYSPRYFNSVDELRGWIKSHYPTSFPEGALVDASLAMQREALADGYIWSVFIEPNTMAPMRYNIISCVVAGDFICYVSLTGAVEPFEKSFLMR